MVINEARQEISISADFGPIRRGLGPWATPGAYSNLAQTSSPSHRRTLHDDRARASARAARSVEPQRGGARGRGTSARAGRPSRVHRRRGRRRACLDRPSQARRLQESGFIERINPNGSGSERSRSSRSVPQPPHPPQQGGWSACRPSSWSFTDGLSGLSVQWGGVRTGGALAAAWRGLERHEEAVDRDDEDVSLDALEPTIAHDARDGERAVAAPAAVSQRALSRTRARCSAV
jgi:hypothetical protein